jgi:stress-induced-phosphoprotein 1
LEAAIKLYKESLTEHRTADVLDKLHKAEKQKKDAEVAAYLDPEKGAEAKERGNTFFRQLQFPEAVKEYSEAIKRDPRNATYYSNRAAALMKLGDYNGAINDCDEALKLDPAFVKAMTRKAQCYYFRKEYHKALDWYERGLAVDKDNEECKNGIERTFQQVQLQSESGTTDEDQVRKAMSDPEIQRILQDPIMQTVLRECGETPGAMKKHMANPGVAEKIKKLMMAGVLRMG